MMPGYTYCIVNTLGAFNCRVIPLFLYISGPVKVTDMNTFSNSHYHMQNEHAVDRADPLEQVYTITIEKNIKLIIKGVCIAQGFGPWFNP